MACLQSSGLKENVNDKKPCHFCRIFVSCMTRLWFISCRAFKDHVLQRLGDMLLLCRSSVIRIYSRNSIVRNPLIRIPEFRNNVLLISLLISWMWGLFLQVRITQSAKIFALRVIRASKISSHNFELSFCCTGCDLTQLQSNAKNSHMSFLH